MHIKICLYVVCIVSLFLINSVTIHVFTAIAVFFLFLAAVPFRKMKSGLFPITLFLLFTFAGNLFFHSGRIIYENGLFSITGDGLRIAEIRTLRVFSMILGAKILTSLMTIDEMVRSLEGILRPLERIGIPVKDFFSVMGLTLKSFPLLMDYLVKTYREEAMSKDIRGFRKRLRHMASFLMPVFVKSIRAPESFFESEDVITEDTKRKA